MALDDLKSVMTGGSRATSKMGGESFATFSSFNLGNDGGAMLDMRDRIAALCEQIKPYREFKSGTAGKNDLQADNKNLKKMSRGGPSGSVVDGKS